MTTISRLSSVPEFARGQVRARRVRWSLEEAGLPGRTRLLESRDQDKAACRAHSPSSRDAARLSAPSGEASGPVSSIPGGDVVRQPMCVARRSAGQISTQRQNARFTAPEGVLQCRARHHCSLGRPPKAPRSSLSRRTAAPLDRARLRNHSLPISRGSSMHTAILVLALSRSGHAASNLANGERARYTYA